MKIAILAKKTKMSQSTVSSYAKRPDDVIFGDFNEDTSTGIITFPGAAIVFNKITKDLATFGTASKMVSKGRRIKLSLKDSPEDATINGENVSPKLWEWTSSVQSMDSSGTGLFSYLDNNVLTLEADKPGVAIYISKSDLIAVDFQFTLESKSFPSKVDNNYTAVWFNGKRYKPETDLFNAFFDTKVGKNHHTITLKDGITRTEQFWIEYDGGKVVEFDLDAIDFGKVQYTEIAPDFATIIQHFRCSWLGEDKVSGALTLKRCDGSTENVPLNLEKIETTQEICQRIVLPYFHRIQTVSFDFSKFVDIVSVLDAKGKKMSPLITFPKQTVQSKQHGDLAPMSFTVQLASNVVFQSTLIPILVPYVEDKPKPMYFSTSLKDVTFKTDGVYMVDGQVYKCSDSQPPFAKVDNGSVTICYNPSLDSFSSYSYGIDGVGKWATTEMRLLPTFDDEYTRLVFSRQTIINFGDFGVKSAKSPTIYYKLSEDGTSKQIKDNKMSIDVPDEIIAGGLVKVVKCMALVDVFECYFTVNIVYESFSRINYNVPGDDNFSGTTGSSMRKRVFNNKFVVGDFMASSDKKLAAYDVIVSSDNEIDDVFLAPGKLIYPVVKFATDNLGTVQTSPHNYLLTTDIINEDRIIKFTTVFAKMNNCNELIVDKNTITVPKTTAICFFRADNTVYLLRPALARNVSFKGLASGASSAASTPVAENNPPPPPVAVNNSPPVVVVKPSQPKTAVSSPMATPKKIPMVVPVVPAGKSKTPLPTIKPMAVFTDKSRTPVVQEIAKPSTVQVMANPATGRFHAIYPKLKKHVREGL